MVKGLKKEFVAGWKKWLVAAVILVLTTKGESIYNSFNTGVKIQKDIEFKHKVDSLTNLQIMTKVKSNEFMMGLMNNPWMIDYKRKEHQKFIDQSLHRDSSKVKMSASLSVKTGMTKSSVIDSIAVILNGMKRGRPINNEQCIYNSKKYGRAYRTMTTH